MKIKNTSRTRSILWVVAGAAAGLSLGATGLVHAATDGSSDSTTAPSAQVAPPHDNQNVDPAAMPNGPGETVLTGDAATSVTEAALAAEPGATVIRVETDSSGHAYEAHVTLADGSQKTLYFTDSFAEDGSEDGFGAPPMHDHQPDGGIANADPSAPASSVNG